VFITRIRHSRILPIQDVLQAMGVAPHTPITAETETEDYNDENENEVIDGPNESSPSDDVKPLARIRELEVIFFCFSDIFSSDSLSSCRWSSSAYVHK